MVASLSPDLLKISSTVCDRDNLFAYLSAFLSLSSSRFGSSWYIYTAILYSRVCDRMRVRLKRRVNDVKDIQERDRICTPKKLSRFLKLRIVDSRFVKYSL